MKLHCWTLQEALAVSRSTRWDHSRNEKKAIALANEAVAFFGKARRLDLITTSDVDAYVMHLRKKGNSAGTINRKLNALSAMFSDAIERDGCSKRPRIRRLTEPQHRIRYLSVAEEMQLLSLFQQWGEKAMREAVVVLIDTGMRRGELFRASTMDVDAAVNIISIWESKGGVPRSIPMTQRVRSIVSTRCAMGGGLLFPELSAEAFRYRWDRARAAMGMAADKQFVPHALRHTFASRLVQRGVPLFVVQKLLGHGEIQVTSRYAHLSDRELHQAVDVLQGSVKPEFSAARCSDD